MRRTHQLPISYYQTELKDNISRFKKLVDLQSQLMIRDYRQGKLQGEVQTLKAENQLLRKRILGEPLSFSQSKNSKQKMTLRESAFERAKALLYQPRRDATTYNHTFYNKSLSHYEIGDSRQKVIDKKGKTANDLSATKAFSNQRSNSAAQLTKEVYMGPSQKQRSLSSVYELSQGNNQNLNVRKKSIQPNNPENDKKIKAQIINHSEFQVKKNKQMVSEPEQKRTLRTLVNQLNFSHLESRKEYIAQGGIPSNLSRKRKHFLSVITLPKKRQAN